jgi:hypothetical protein
MRARMFPRNTWRLGDRGACSFNLLAARISVRAVGTTGMRKGRNGQRVMVRPSLWAAALVIAVLTVAAHAGCNSGGAAPPKPDAQDRLSKLLNLYRAYTDKNQKPPPSEEALREFAAKMTAEERSARLIGDDVENIFISPRDNEKFVVKYNLRPEAAVNRALAWEAKGTGGMHWVALTMGYVVEYDEEQLKQYTK